MSESRPQTVLDAPEPARGTPEWYTTPTKKGEPAKYPRLVHPDDVCDPCVIADNFSSERFKDRYPNPFTMIDILDPWGLAERQDWGDTVRTIVELRMCALSSVIRDKPQWYAKMQDRAIRAKWREEALSQALSKGSKKEWALTEEMVSKINFVDVYTRTLTAFRSTMSLQNLTAMQSLGMKPLASKLHATSVFGSRTVWSQTTIMQGY